MANCCHSDDVKWPEKKINEFTVATMGLLQPLQFAVTFEYFLFISELQTSVP